MPDQPFDRTIINLLEKGLSPDINRYLSQLDRSLRFFVKSMYSATTGVPISGFLQNAFNAAESSPQAMSVVLKAGLGFQDLPFDVPTDIDGVIGLDDRESYKPLPLLSDLTVAIATAPTAPSSRIDIIEVRADRLKTDSQLREVFSNSTEVFTNTPVDKTLEFILDATKLGTVTSPAASTAAISVKQGIPGTPGVAPVATAGYLKIAEIAVGGDVIIITDADITDFRNPLQNQIATKEIYIPASACLSRVDSGGNVESEYTPGRWESRVGQPFGIDIPLSQHLRVGDRLLSVRLYVAAGGAAQIDCSLQEQSLPGAALVARSTVVQTSGAGDQSVDLTNISFNGATNILESDTQYSLVTFDSGGGAPAGHAVYGARIIFDHPIT